MKWTTACPDWAERLKSRRSIIPPPLYPSEAAEALAVFKSLRVMDLPGRPTFGECCDDFVFDFVAAIFGAYEGEHAKASGLAKENSGQQKIREFFLLISKKNAKSTIAAGVMLTALIRAWRHEEEHLILSPTKEVADNSFKPAASMVRADPDLSAMFHIQDHLRTITHRVTKRSLKVVAADTDTVSGKKAGRVLVDEHWLFGTKSHAKAMFMEALGGQVSRPEGFVIYLTTQSDEPPAGVFLEKLRYARDVRDGKVVDPKFLPVLYEFPDDMIKSKAYLDPANFYITNPNIGRSVSQEWLADELRKQQHNTDGTFQQFLAKHLNVEIGTSLRSDRWAGAEFWDRCADSTLTLEALLERAEVCTIGLDGGGLDDLFGLVVIGRDRESRKWLWWSHAWVHEIALERRKEIAPRLRDFEQAGELTIVAAPGDDVEQVANIISQVRDAGLLPTKHAIGVDPAGIGAVIDELVSQDRGFSLDQITAVQQGWKLNGAIKTTERALAGGEVLHGGGGLMSWCVGNARVVQVGNAITITKQASGTAKIDPLMAGFSAVTMMALNPQAESIIPFAVLG